MEEQTPQRNERIYQIGELAQALDMSQRTVRYYEEIGLLSPVKRLEGGKRVYSGDDMQRLKLIKRLKIMGLSLTEIQELNTIWSFEKSNEKLLARMHELLDTHLRRLDDRIADLTILRNEITDYRERIGDKLAVLRRPGVTDSQEKS
ncbi:MAG TPA: MerR family transcriptional regulator [Spirochaetota bacterium]|nr:MerR family transcriptional regulator [Spirochaetota bacterium]HPC41366.1 MerR family transcriptional regulator [Spirochaetota bacterium]HPL15461.1 MerR family transcriptional regulator [Spirochaetota bacterium]HQF10045.1 MerR family transcriptional regulator [Spirochaetota bacterium]HQH98640.1 MerR family transcriptional regulator [Spirochaetota bacterium]